MFDFIISNIYIKKINLKYLKPPFIIFKKYIYGYLFKRHLFITHNKRLLKTVSINRDLKIYIFMGVYLWVYLKDTY